MSGSTKYKVKNGKGAKLTISISLATREKNPPIDKIRAMLVERNNLLEDQCRVDVEQELERMLVMGRESKMRSKANAAYRLQRRRSIENRMLHEESVAKKKEHQRRIAEIRQRRINAVLKWENSEKELLTLIHKNFPHEVFFVANRFGTTVSLDFTMSSHHNIKLKDKYIALVHAGDQSVSMLVEAVNAVDFDRSALDFWNNELFGDECSNANKINYEYA